MCVKTKQGWAFGISPSAHFYNSAMLDSEMRLQPPVGTSQCTTHRVSPTGEIRFIRTLRIGMAIEPSELSCEQGEEAVGGNCSFPLKLLGHPR